MFERPTLLPTAQRLFAYWLDMVLAFSVLGGVQALLAMTVGFPSWDGFGQNAWLLEGWVLLTISAPTWIYFIISDVHGGATVGKRLLGLRVELAAGGRVSVKQALGRTAIKLLPWEISHVAVMLPTPLLLPETIPTIGQNAGLFIANMAIVIYVAGLVADRGVRALHDRVMATQVVRLKG